MHVLAKGLWRLPARRLPVPLLKEGFLLLAGYFAYALTKSLIHDDPADVAFRNAWDVARFEMWLGVFHEPAIQRWFLDHARFVVHFSNWFYTLGYWPCILPMAFVIWRRDRRRYAATRTIAFIAFGIVLIVYAAFPLAPPRMLPGFADTLMALPGAGFGTSAAFLANPYAAMPSVHYGLALLVAIALYRLGGFWWKATAVAYQGLMFLTIVVTANHYFLDVLGAVAVVALGFALRGAAVSVARGGFRGLRSAYSRRSAEPA